MLHLTGYNVTMEDLKNFRQVDSITAGHPENTLIRGIEVSTGPLGQVRAYGVVCLGRWTVRGLNVVGRRVGLFRVVSDRSIN